MFQFSDIRVDCCALVGAFCGRGTLSSFAFPLSSSEKHVTDTLTAPLADPKVAAPRPPQFTSIPSLLSSLQNEYDSIIFEMITLKKQYDSVRQELASALYTNDAANRVIARLLKERDEAREALANIGGTLGNGAAASTAAQQDTDMAAGDAGAAVAAGALPADALAEIDATAARLSSQRKPKSKQKAPAGYATPAQVPSFAQTKSLPSMHSTKPPGISALALSGNGNWVITGGNDKQVQIYDRVSDQVVATLKGHTKPITCVAFEPPSEVDIGSEAAGALPPPRFAVSASEDKTVRIWRAEPDGSKWALAHTLKGFKDAVTGIDVHPAGKLLGVASRDATWALYDIESGKALISIDAPASGAETEEEAAGGYAYESLAFHPDGQLLATGTKEGVIRVWDVKTAAKATTFRGSQVGSAITALSFSENGYYLAAAAKNSTIVQVWDLRKLSVAGTIEAAVNSDDSLVSDVAFDPSAQFLAVVGSDAKVYANKSWSLLYTFDGNAAEITSADWDAKDGSLVVASLDRTLRTVGVPSQ
ncbi:WD40 repeat-like protein [Tilletiaria anomala UBC 951]|uniref:Pre-mRNA-processing factor 19 n=1 Tax=Tilletiaria anomala (strain ATCC 24038 / CBS 436.72 / UBC 951) TaxID=1037660 RepID=A0A066WP72_TILAU|nr:WD40 repeat-like protein [Tilletiaria anomala UBC 951]KDN52819.1 WD40 repeat-like protein [Tilletiaria anomala UBC 951]